MNFVLTAVSLMLLIEPFLSWFRNRRSGVSSKRSLAWQPYPSSQLFVWLQCAAGAMVGWGMSEIGTGYEFVLASVFMAVFALMGFVRRFEDELRSDRLAFFDVLFQTVSAGADFFDGLAEARKHLYVGHPKRAVEDVLRRYAARRSLEECLVPFSRAGGFFAGLAADILQSGWEHSSALSLSVHQMRERVIKDWARKHRLRRAFRASVKVWPVILPFAWGLAAYHVLSRPDFPDTTRSWAIFLAFFVVFRSVLFARSSTGPMVAFGAALVCIAFLLLHLEPSQATAHRFGNRVTKASNHRMERLVPEASSAHSRECVVSTGFDPGWLRIRSGPGMNAPPVGYAAEGQILDLAGLDQDDPGEWLYIRSGKGLEGWIHAPYCPPVDRP